MACLAEQALGAATSSCVGNTCLGNTCRPVAPMPTCFHFLLLHCPVFAGRRRPATPSRACIENFEFVRATNVQQNLTPYQPSCVRGSCIGQQAFHRGNGNNYRAALWLCQCVCPQAERASAVCRVQLLEELTCSNVT